MAIGKYFTRRTPKGQLPPYVAWVINLLIPILVACVNCLMVAADIVLVRWKYDTNQAVMQSSGLTSATIAMAGMSLMFGTGAALLVLMVAPSCAGSGLPEVLGFLNGNQLLGLFSLRSTVVRTVGIVLSQASGFPIGREGPMVAIGGGIGFGVAYILTQPYEKSFEKTIPGNDEGNDNASLSTSSIIVNQERFAHVCRIGCALGGAAGVATAFNSPIGGILCMFEAMRTSSLAPKFHLFMCTVISAFVVRFIFGVSNMDVSRLVIYDESASNAEGAWDWFDAPMFLILAAVLGAAGGLATHGAVRIWSFRTRMAKKLRPCQRPAKLCECMLYCILCACAFNLVPSILGCTAMEAASPATADHHRHLSGGSTLMTVRYTCSEGEHNEAATLLLQGAEGAVKHLYSRSGVAQSSGPVLLALFTYGILALGMPGLCVPMGTFLPSLLTGALVGRLLGEAVTSMGLSWGIPTASAGVYAVIGSAAMLSGFTHMTVGIVALLCEAVNDISIAAPLMAVVYIANFVSRCVSRYGYDEQLILKKDVPFLDTDLPKELENSKLTALDVCYLPPRDALLPCKATIRMIKRALRLREVNYFPILAEGGQCVVGLTTRGRLKAVLEAVKDHPILGRRSDSDDCSGLDVSVNALFPCRCCPSRWRSDLSSKKSQGNLSSHQAENKIKCLIKEMFSKPEQLYDDTDDGLLESHLLPIDRIMEPAPCMIQESMPVHRFYYLFRNVDMNVICVLSHSGRFLGILTRRGLIAAAKILYDGHTVVQQTVNEEACADRPPIKGLHKDDMARQISPIGGYSPFNYGDCYSPSRGGLRTPSETDAGSSVYDSTESSDSPGDEESYGSPRIEIEAASPPGSEDGGRMNRRSNSFTSLSSHGSRPSQRGLSNPSSPKLSPKHVRGKQRSHTSGSSVSSNCSTAALAMIENLGPGELRAQLASAWSQLASSEKKTKMLHDQVLETEQDHEGLLLARMSTSASIHNLGVSAPEPMDTTHSSQLPGALESLGDTKERHIAPEDSSVPALVVDTLPEGSAQDSAPEPTPCSYDSPGVATEPNGAPGEGSVAPQAVGMPPQGNVCESHHTLDPESMPRSDDVPGVAGASCIQGP